LRRQILSLLRLPNFAMAAPAAIVLRINEQG
jgi:hypothetical protein